MALSRRSGNRFQGAIWPGYVDAVTGLLMVLTFVLTIFMVVQFVLRETISGQESELDQLTSEVALLSQALGLERDRSARLQSTLSQTSEKLEQAQADLASQSALIASLTQERADQDRALAQARAEITNFEAQVATLLAQRDEARGSVADLTTERDGLLSDKQALELALAQARDEIDEGAEAARLAAARREALEALIADLERQAGEAEAAQAALTARVGDLETALSDEEKARLAEAAAAEALREKLQNADAELTAMTMALEEQRRKAEDTLTLLAAAEDAQDDLDLRLAAALLDLDGRADTLANERAAFQAEKTSLEDQIADLQARLAAATQSDAERAAERAALITERDDLKTQVATLSARLDEVSRTGAEAAARSDTLATEKATLEEQLAALRARLTAALTAAQEATEARGAAETARADLEARVAGLQAQLDQVLASDDAQAADRAALRDQLAAALAAKLKAEQEVQAQLSKAEERAILLQQANKELAGEQAQSAEAARRTTLLNQQVAELRTQLGSLQALLDDYKDRDAANRVQIQSLGTDLNAALAQKAAEEKRRRELEEAERKRLESERDQLEKYRSEFFGQLRDVFAGLEGVRIVGDRFVFSSEVLFAPGSADLSVEGQAQITGITETLRRLGNDIPAGIDWILRVDGHTDDVPLSGLGEFRDNWELSQARALSVVRYMVDFLGFPPARLAANGFGQYQPIAAGTSPEARAANRRIELKFTER